MTTFIVFAHAAERDVDFMASSGHEVEDVKRWKSNSLPFLEESGVASRPINFLLWI